MNGELSVELVILSEGKVLRSCIESGTRANASMFILRLAMSSKSNVCCEVAACVDGLEGLVCPQLGVCVGGLIDRLSRMEGEPISKSL